MNKYIATGNIVREIEMTYTGGGLAILKNCLAVKDTFKKDTTYFHNFVVFGKTAETMANHLHKGSKILIEGQLTQSNYEKDGQKRSSTDINVDRFEFLDSKKDEPQQAPRKNLSNNEQSRFDSTKTKQDNYNDFNNTRDPFANGESIDIQDDDLPF